MGNRLFTNGTRNDSHSNSNVRSVKISFSESKETCVQLHQIRFR